MWCGGVCVWGGDNGWRAGERGARGRGGGGGGVGAHDVEGEPREKAKAELGNINQLLRYLTTQVESQCWAAQGPRKGTIMYGGP